jgi:hypothetical protein
MFILALASPVLATNTNSEPLPTTATVTSATDFFFTVTEQTSFTASTSQFESIGSDPHLWLYNDQGTLLAANDDYFGLQSYIAISISPGSYRLRAGVCCGNPDGWPTWDPNYAYSITFNTGYSSSTGGSIPTTTTTVPQFVGAPTNLTVDNGLESVTLSWNAPQDGTRQPERYAVSWRIPGLQNSERAIASNQTTITIPYSTLDDAGSLNQLFTFRIRSDNDTYQLYSSWSNEVTVYISGPGVSIDQPNTLLYEYGENADELVQAPLGKRFSRVLFASYGTPSLIDGVLYKGNCHAQSSEQVVQSLMLESNAFVLSASNDVFGDPCGGTGKRLKLLIEYEDDPAYVAPTTTTTTTTVVIIPPMITTTTPPVATTTTSTTTTTEPPVATTTTAAPPETTTTAIARTTTTTTSPAVQTTTTTAAPTTTTTVPVENKLPVPRADEISKIETKEELEKLIETVDLASIKPAQAVALIANSAFMALSTDKLEAVFSSISVSDLSPTQETELARTLTAAPDSVKSTFEGTVDIYGEGFDDYVPTGSAVDVKTRRSVIAVTTLMSATAVAGAAPGTGGGTPGGGGSGNNNPTSDNNNAARKEEEQEDEEAGGLEGPEDREKNENTRNSIFTYGENNMKKFSIIGFIKKFAKETAALSFTFAGSAIMFVTLSGETRKIAIIATIAAVTVHYISVMLENDSE